MSAQPKMTKAEWEARGAELFGPDKQHWRFRCPACKRETSIAETRAAFPDKLDQLRAGKYSVEGECIGRHLPDVGCNWATYGLFRGPAFVVDDGREVPVFEFATPPTPSTERP